MKNEDMEETLYQKYMVLSVNNFVLTYALTYKQKLVREFGICELS